MVTSPNILPSATTFQAKIHFRQICVEIKTAVINPITKIVSAVSANVGFFKTFTYFFSYGKEFKKATQLTHPTQIAFFKSENYVLERVFFWRNQLFKIQRKTEINKNVC